MAKFIKFESYLIPIESIQVVFLSENDIRLVHKFLNDQGSILCQDLIETWETDEEAEERFNELLDQINE